MSSNSIFDEKYAKLNKKQKEAVDTIEGPVMVVAGPGTGKTTILTLRIANILLQTDTPPSGILALTFTDAGVKAMRTKLREIIGSRADEVRVHTFHGFAASVISEFDDHFISVYRSKQITDIESESFLREILKDKKFTKLRPLGDADYYIGKILSAISNCKRDAWTPEIVKNFAKDEIERINADPDAISSRGATKGELKAESQKRIERCEKTILFSEIYEKYEQKKKDERKIDFDDLIFELLQALKNDELLLRLLQEKFLYILVDEHQDTNDSQNLIVTKLADFFDTPNIFIVGDEKQAIYRFQGASVQNFLRFQNIWKEMKIIPLEENYRSHQSILDATFGMIEKNYEDGKYEDLRVKLSSRSSDEIKPIDYILTGNNYSADKYLVSNISKIVNDFPDSKTAIIVRSNKDVEYILSLCNLNGINATAERGIDIFTHPLGAIYFGILEYLYDPTNIEALTESLASGLWNIDFEKSVKIIKGLRSGTNMDVWNEIPALNNLREEMTKSGVIQYLILVSDLSGMTEKMEQTSESAEVWRNIISLARDLAESLNISDPRKLIAELLAYKKTAESRSIKISSGKMESNVIVMTAHSSKGLEYDYVFLPFATEESWMFRRRTSAFILPMEKDDTDDVKDSRRLFYVALTRAKKHAVIISSQKDSTGRDLIPLRFIDELDKNHVIKKEIPFENEEIKHTSIANIKSKRKEEIIEFTKRIIVEKGLSVTALNHFLDCPSEFLYKSILKIPEAPSASSEKGIAMHKALSTVWKEDDKSVKSISNIILKAINEYFKTSLLSSFEKEVIVDELTLSAPKVANALHEHFNLKGNISVEKWIEKFYSTTFDGKKIEFNLHGQLDVILESDSKIEVFDYKTREAMSENAIKGMTKDSDGNYFRQLVYYKMLLESNSNFNTREILPSLVFVKPDNKGQCKIVNLPISESDEKNVQSEIEDLIKKVWSGEFMTLACDDPKCKWCGMKFEFLK